MTCFTDQPGMQLYVASQPMKQPGKNGKIYDSRTSVCLETQHFPDAINHDNFPSIVLHPDAPFHSKTLYHFLHSDKNNWSKEPHVPFVYIRLYFAITFLCAYFCTRFFRVLTCITLFFVLE